jgi:hypothetical protein
VGDVPAKPRHLADVEPGRRADVSATAVCVGLKFDPQLGHALAEPQSIARPSSAATACAHQIRDRGPPVIDPRADVALAGPHRIEIAQRSFHRVER